MEWGNPIVAIVIIAMLMVTAIITNWIQARAKVQSNGASRKEELLERENAGLKQQVGELERRLAVLERIATDPAERTAREIEQLR